MWWQTKHKQFYLMFPKMNVLKTLLGFILIIPLACNSSDNRQLAEKPAAKADTATSTLKVGAEILLQDHLDELEGKRVGLVMNPTARVNGTHMLDTLLSRNVNLTALFAPEHGFRGEAGAGETIEDGEDKATGLPVYSLYGKTRKPTPEMLQNVDVLLFDMQDVGARFYTYNATMGLVLEAAADAEVPVWVLDRPNPAGGEYVTGWLLEQQYKSFVGAYPIPMAHGMTLGELAQMMIGERWLQTVKQPQLKVISMRGWKRSMKWPQTGLEWHPPSPNLPTFEHAFMYLGTVLFEGTNLSEGRGTPDPFLTIGSPATDLTDEQLDSLRTSFPSVIIDRAKFAPESIPGKSLNPKLEGQTCSGVRLSVTDYSKFNPVQFGLQLLELMLKNTKNGEMNEFIYKLAGSRDVEDFSSDWGIGVEVFKEAREPYLLYK
jgi:uncharacterized protein YbbC (DUF1343 family)